MREEKTDHPDLLLRLLTGSYQTSSMQKDADKKAAWQGETLKQAAFSNGLFEEKIKIIIMKRYAPELNPANR